MPTMMRFQPSPLVLRGLLAAALTSLVSAGALSCSSATNAPANAYVTSTLGQSSFGGCTINQSADTPFLAIGTDVNNPVPNGGNYMGSAVAVTCQVLATSTTSFTVSGQVTEGTIGGFSFSGTLTNAPGAQPNFTAAFNKSPNNLNSTDCTVTLNPNGTTADPSITSGRVWATLSCPALMDPTTSGDVCDGSATFVLQNCDD